MQHAATHTGFMPEGMKLELPATHSGYPCVGTTWQHNLAAALSRSPGAEDGVSPCVGRALPCMRAWVSEFPATGVISVVPPEQSAQGGWVDVCRLLADERSFVCWLLQTPRLATRPSVVACTPPAT